MREIAAPWRAGTPPHPLLVAGVMLAALAIGILPLPIAGAMVLGVASVLLTLARLEYGLVLLAFTVPFGSLGEIEAGEFSLSATEFIVPLVVLAWVVRMAVSHEARISLPWIVWPLALFLSAMALSFTNSASLGLSLKELAKWLEFLAVLLLVGNTIRDRRQVKLLLAAVLVAGVVAGLHGWYQFALREGPGSFLVSDQFLRAYGFYGQPNPFAGYLLSVTPLALALLLVAYRGQLPFRPLAYGFGVLAAALVMTLSRGGILGLAGASAFVGIVQSKAVRPYVNLALLLVLLFGLAVSFGVVSLPGGEQDGPLAEFGVFDPRNVIPTPQNWSVVERMALWYSAWHMWSDSPWLGVGIGNFPAVYPDYAIPRWEFGQEHAHNYYLNVLTETGVLGLGAYLVFLASLFIYVARSLKASMAHGWRLGSGICLGVLAVLGALSIHNLFDNIYVHGMLVQMGILLGLIPVATRMGEDGA